MRVGFYGQPVAELIQPLWAARQAGEFMTDAFANAGTYRKAGLAGRARPVGYFRAAGAACEGVGSSFGQREEIAHGRAGVSRSARFRGVGMVAVDDQRGIGP